MGLYDPELGCFGSATTQDWKSPNFCKNGITKNNKNNKNGRSPPVPDVTVDQP